MNKMVLLAMAFLPLCVEAQVYRWVDENGKVHYGDRPVAKEVSRVRGLIDPTAADPLPKPGMKAADVRAAYGEPERVRKVSTRSGETEIWAYRKSKRIRQDFVVKIEGGEVAEVATDTATEAVQPTVASNVQGTARTAADAEYRQQQALAQQETEQREQRCIGLRESLQRIDSQERRGGSAAAMDSLREQKRQAGERLSAQGC